MGYQRLILHYGPDQLELKGILSDEAVTGCWFELQRQGGCGAGELRLRTEFPARLGIQPGDWIACEYELGVRWYLGRVERIENESPAGTRVRLEGPGIELNEVYPGALRPTAAGFKPHRYARDNRFSEDPDRAWESVDEVWNTQELVELLIQQYVVPRTRIQYESTLVESGPAAEDVVSVKLRGEETVRAVLKDAAVRAGNASWGVDAAGRFFFLQQRETVQATYQENLDLTRLTETRTLDRLFNRVMLTGDYVYDRRDASDHVARRSYRWRGNYRHVKSAELYGERRIRMWVPWIRTAQDAGAFVQEFFRAYSTPAPLYLVETRPLGELPIPWLGRVELRDRNGALLASGQPETVRVHFDHEPWFRLELGPGDPRELWPEPPHDERWELPDEQAADYGGTDYETLDEASDSGPWSSVASHSDVPPDQSDSGYSWDSAESLESDSSLESDDSWESEYGPSSSPDDPPESSEWLASSSAVGETSDEEQPASSEASFETESGDVPTSFEEPDLSESDPGTYSEEPPSSEPGESDTHSWPVSSFEEPDASSEYGSDSGDPGSGEDPEPSSGLPGDSWTDTEGDSGLLSDSGGGGESGWPTDSYGEETSVGGSGWESDWESGWESTWESTW